MSPDSRHRADQQREAWQRFERGEDSAPPAGWPDHDALAQLESVADLRWHSLTESVAEDTLSLLVEATTGIPELVGACEQLGVGGICIPIDASPADPLSGLRGARAACNLPLMARGTIVHPLQIRALRAVGADAVLFSARMFEQEEDTAPDLHLAELVAFSQQLGLEVGVSIRSAEHLGRALAAEPDLLNIDNRHGSGRVDVERTLELLADVPVGTPVLSESIARGDEVPRLHAAGVDGLVLDDEHIGEELAVTLAAYRTLMLGEQI